MVDEFKEINKIVKPQGFVFEKETCDLCGKHGIVAASESPTIMGSISEDDEGTTWLRVCNTCVAARTVAFALLNPAQGGTTDESAKRE
jgi:hypothetical protein